MILMMGLGYKQSHKSLRNPKYLHTLRRADEDLGDVVVLGAILTFGIGTFLWMLLEGNSPAVFEFYTERAKYLSFLFLVLHLFLIGSLLIWFMDTSTSWPRIVIVAVAGFVGGIALFGGVLGGDEKWEVAANALIVLYSIAVIWVALAQLISFRNAADD